ncbi:unnamed protein product [Rotaria magnacalcarata]|uniref:Uncharacterized protein n=2 Tax=Rotaria magnacalcarata TaxID=392030 RepID=A0A815HVS4_9BILA|nr:unnamed protein product [Rotaria magnacalcarata]CAF4147381.1 unnamed protein product [Rotaria magnacalcarata]
MTSEQLTRIKQERSMSTENSMIMIELLIQFIKCIIKNIKTKHLDHYRLLLIFFSDIIVNTTPIVDSDSAKQTEIAIENLTKEIIAQEILFTQCHRYLEQDSNKGIEVLESAEYEWKSETKSGQQQTDDLFSSPINSILSLFSYLDKIRYW